MRLSGDVLRALEGWLPGNDEPDRPQMQLATVDAVGRPDVRTVLLSAWSADGFSFHTDSTSRKAEQLEARPAVGFAIVWPSFSRQLVVQGTAHRQERQDEADAFARRSPYLRQLAWQNTAEFAMLPYDDRVSRWSMFQTEHASSMAAAPDTWAGFVIRPERLTFWQSDPATASHREEYTAANGRWVLTHRAG